MRSAGSGCKIALDRREYSHYQSKDYARSERGKRAYGEQPSRTKNGSVVGAISLKDGLLAQWSTLGYLDALTFDAFIAQKLGPKL